MLTRLVAAGLRVSVFDQDPARSALARNAGAAPAASPAAVAGASDAVFLCLPDGDAVREAVFGPTACVTGGMRNKLVIDTSSIDPTLTVELASRLAHDAGGRWIDAPVSGGVRGATDGTLVALLGGAPEDIAAARDFITCFAHRIVHLGPTGSGQWAKLCNQAIICGTIALWTEVLALARAGNIEPQALVAALEGARADSPVRQAFGAELAAGRFVPSRNLRKDMANVLARARAAGNNIPVLSTVARAFADPER
jgi:3-hydroxyisobutyrate dehydrogenase